MAKALDNPARASETVPMTAQAISLAPRLQGRAQLRLQTELVGPVTEADLALLASEREVPIQPSLPQRLRERHHALARCLAQGMTSTEASMVTGYDICTISILQRSPTFRALVDDYSSIEDGLQADFMERTATLSLTAVNRMQEALEDEASPVPVSMALEIAKFAADRTGHAPVQRSVSINANVNLGDRMAAARQRLSQLVEGKKVGSADS